MPYRRTARLEARFARDREQILRAARDVVRADGFAGARMASVAAVAGVGTGSLYRHFPSKEALFSELLRQICARELAVVQEVMAVEAPPVARLGDGIGCFARRALAGGRLAYSVIVEPMDPGVDRVRLEARRELSLAFSRVIDDAMSAGELPAQDGAVSGAAIVGSILEALVAPLTHGETDGDDRVREITVFCLRAVGADPTPPGGRVSASAKPPRRRRLPPAGRPR